MNGLENVRAGDVVLLWNWDRAPQIRTVERRTKKYIVIPHGVSEAWFGLDGEPYRYVTSEYSITAPTEDEIKEVCCGTYRDRLVSEIHNAVPWMPNDVLVAIKELCDRSEKVTYDERYPETYKPGSKRHGGS